MTAEGCGDDMSDAAWCLDCGDEFHYDDTGGYNPPCRCTAKCRSCCEHDCERDGDTWEGTEDDPPSEAEL